MTKNRLLSLFLILTLSLTALVGFGEPPVLASGAEPLPQEHTVPETLQGIPGATTEWWATVQEEIRQSEYHITPLAGTAWQGPTPPANLPAAYQAPNRAHNLRTVFRPQGIQVIPRVFEGETPPWEWGLRLTGYGYEGTAQPVADASLDTDGNRIEYARGRLTEWYVNDEHGLEQGFTLHAPPRSAIQSPPSTVILSLDILGTLIPHLPADGSAIEFTTSGGVEVLRYGGLVVTDAAGRAVPAHLELLTPASGTTRQVLGIVLDATAARYPVTVDPLTTSPDWTAESDQIGADLGFSVGTAGDVNGDGYSDVIVGAYLYDLGRQDNGSALVYLGSAAGLATTWCWRGYVLQDGAHYGASVGTAGDVNGDGYADVIVGAPLYDTDFADRGRAYVYHGRATGLSPTAKWTRDGQGLGWFGTSVATAGDVNGDGYSDVIIAAPIYDRIHTEEGRVYVFHGSAGGLSASVNWRAESNQDSPRFGAAVGTAGDVNGDGYSDVIVGAPRYDHGETNEGCAFVWHGSANGVNNDVNGTPANAAWMAESDQNDAGFGMSVGTAGDVDGDGYSDVIVGASRYDHGEENEGGAFVWHGSASGVNGDVDGTPANAAWTAEGDQADAAFGRSATAGDVDGDGYSDVIVGANQYDNGQTGEGRAYVFRGGASGLAATADWTAESDQAGARLGISVGTAGDVNGDGYSDVIIGAHQYDNGEPGEGRAYVYHGSASGLAAAAGWTAESNKLIAQFGFSVGTAGDVNGDGYGDVIVSAPYYNAGETDEGRVFVYHGSATGLSATADWTAKSDQGDTDFGSSVGTAGDVNGDGYSDVIVGAYRYDHGETDEGCAFVWHGSANGVNNDIDGTPANAAWADESNQEGAHFGESVGTAGDVNGDGYADVIVGAASYEGEIPYEGRAFVYHGSASGLSATPNWTADGGQSTAFFGESVGTAGDVNGDGYSDVIVGAFCFDNGESNEGRASVYHGSSSGLATGSADWTAEADQEDAYFGTSVGTAGDVNGDGYSDVIVGADGYTQNKTEEGRVFVYHGSAAGLSTTADWTAEGDKAGACLGTSVGTAGDVNGDGYGDVVVGAPYYDNGQNNEGLGAVYHGSETGLATAADWTVESDQDDAWFGWSVGTAGDVNGDGYADVIVGARCYDNGKENEGRASVYYGNGGDGLPLLPRQVRGGGPVPIDRLGMSDSRAFQLRLLGRMPLGREDVRLAWQVAPLGTSIAATNVFSGTSDWTDVLTTGVAISQTVSGLVPGTPYHWRVRLLYRPGNALGQPAGRWVHIPWAGWNETDLRTALNQPPAADAGPDQAVTPGATVTLDGSGSSDPDGDLPLACWWTQTGGAAVSLTPNLSVTTFPAPAGAVVLTFTLAVTDNLGLADPTPDEVVVTVRYRIYLPLVRR
jgi:hypothetical protein